MKSSVGQKHNLLGPELMCDLVSVFFVPFCFIVACVKLPYNNSVQFHFVHFLINFVLTKFVYVDSFSNSLCVN